MDGKASARVTQVEQVWVQKKIATNLSNLLRSSEIPFFQLCQLFTAHNLPSEESLEIRKQIWWAAWIWKRLDIDKHIFSFLKPWCLIKTWEPRCKLLYNLAVSPMSTLTDLRWVTDGESFLKWFKIPFLFATFLISFVLTSLREVFETPGSRVVGDLLVTKLIFLTRCICCKVMSAKKSLKQLEWQQ